MNKKEEITYEDFKKAIVFLKKHDKGRYTKILHYYQTDHYHCWNQGKKPACGIPLEKHKICCLCAIKYKKKSPPTRV